MKEVKEETCYCYLLMYLYLLRQYLTDLYRLKSEKGNLLIVFQQVKKARIV